MTDRTTDRYVADAREWLKEQLDENVEEAMAKHLQLRRHMLQLALEAGDLTNARQIAKDLADLQDLYAPDRLQVEGELEQNVSVYLPSNGREGGAPSDGD